MPDNEPQDLVASAGDAELSELEDPTLDEAEIEALAAELEATKDSYLRTLAEFQNFRKRVHQEKHDLHRTAAQDLLRDLLPVLDNFERTLAAVDSGASVESLAEGVRAVDRQLRSLLERRHVVRIPAAGMPFDPSLHEPLGVDVTNEVAEDTVTVEIEPGYRIGDKVLRPARVRVAKKP